MKHMSIGSEMSNTMESSSSSIHGSSLNKGRAKTRKAYRKSKSGKLDHSKKGNFLFNHTQETFRSILGFILCNIAIIYHILYNCENTSLVVRITSDY